MNPLRTNIGCSCLFSYARHGYLTAFFATATSKKKVVKVDTKKAGPKGYVKKPSGPGTSLTDALAKATQGATERLKMFQQALFNVDPSHKEGLNDLSRDDFGKRFVIEYAAYEKQLRDDMKLQEQERAFLQSKYRALKALRDIDYNLYMQAVQPNYSLQGEPRPMTETLPIKPLFQEPDNK
jgi:hypothetical protein